MARKAKRRSERRPSSRPGGASLGRPGAVAAGAGPLDDLGTPADGEDLLEAPDPIEHATPDVELAEAQLAVGRPEPGVEPSEAELEAEAMAAQPRARRTRLAAESAPAVRPAPGGNRLVHFAQGSWRELQRVQWPDRRQVMQATGVVIGFVIIAGVFLGVADLVASHLVTAILK